MFKWVLNTPLKLAEYNLNIYLMLFELKKLFSPMFWLFHSLRECALRRSETRIRGPDDSL